MTLRKLILFTLIFVLNILIFQMTVKIKRRFVNRKELNVKGVYTIETSNNNDFEVPQSSPLKYFWEPKSNNYIEENVEWLDKNPVYTINSDTLNERFEYKIEKKHNIYRILTLGDSFTYGLYVNTKENYTELLEERLNSDLICQDGLIFEVINLGVPGYDFDYIVERFITRGLKYNPDLVMWLIPDYEVRRVNEFFYDDEYRNTMKKLGKVTIERQLQIDQDKLEEIEDKYGRVFLLDYHKKKLEVFLNLVGNNAIFYIFPSLSGDVKNLLSILNNDMGIAEITDTINNPDLHFDLDYHPNQQGHKQLANDIFQNLVNNNFSGCRVR